MKFDYCAMHAGSVIGELDLNCRVIRHDDGTAAKPAEVWAEIERLRSIGREAAEAATMHQAEVLRLRAALRTCARQAEALKRDCGMDPESAQAIRNAQYQSISTTAHIALGTIKGPVT